jgi:anaerobic ribonucleoside-triphosphate reductase activating protein
MANEAALAHRIVSENGTTIEGVTVSGGAPVLQEAALERFLAGLRHESSLSVLLFSGYRIEEIVRMKQGTAILSMTDILVDGPYDRNRHLGRGLLGSSNQRVHFLSSRYGPSDLEGLTDSEVQIDSKGVIVVTGIDRLRYRSPAAYRKERFRRAKFQVS